MKTGSVNEAGKAAISIIIPVYNVFEWLDQCLESVMNQTFSDFEVILIDDGSTDGSELKCREWEKKDGRISLISKSNEGPSKARNLGLQRAAGTYLAFLDADDWIDRRYLEIMYKHITETDADLVECDVYRVNSETGIKTYRVCSGCMGRDYTLKEHMKYGYTAIWKCLFKKELFIKNDITFPDCHSEARAVYPLLLALSNRVENVHEALYYYRIFRKGSLTAQPRPANEDENAIGIQASDIMLQGFERCGLYSEYETILQQIVKLKLSDLLAVFFYRKEKEDFQKLTENYHAFITDRFPGTPDYPYIVIGGYNLNRILGHMNILHNPYCRFNFTGLISLMNPVDTDVPFRHKNRYREIMLKREFENQFWDIIHEIMPEYLFIDFIEERFDIFSYGNGYLTKSDALEDAECSLENAAVIKRNTKECRSLWEKSCLEFLKRLQDEYPSINIVLIENYLSEQVGDVHVRNTYENIDEIRKLNRILKSYYDFLKLNCNKLKVIEAYKSDYYFTDQQYEYGAIPSHLNEIANQKIAEMIERSIEA